MFPTAMKSFARNPEPKKLSRSPYHIRLEQNWIGVYEKLGAARRKYIDTKGIAGKLREAGRTLGDNVRRHGKNRNAPRYDASEDLARANQVAVTVEFNTWLTTPASTKLLVHGNFSGLQSTSPLSAFCVSLTQSLRKRDEFVVLAWFCGRHASTDEDDEAVGGQAMIWSFITQLLQQCGPLLVESGKLNITRGGLDRIMEDLVGVDRLCAALCWLVRCLPRNLTVFFLVDGISYYEQPEFEDDAADALMFLLRMMEEADKSRPDQPGPVAIKVLVTSAFETQLVRVAFEDEGLIVALKAMPAVKSGPNRPKSSSTFNRDEMSDVDKIDEGHKNPPLREVNGAQAAIPTTRPDNIGDHLVLRKQKLRAKRNIVPIGSVRIYWL
ncbi:hypothetical protein B0I35DRAFT_484083 [Stachybotrys elegans]|uniref:Uncharacterized protein n=1 Tax=Stachybotrys elegans TaxID=80388 RepID=A0A8K0SK44_9HYPO|nr:hypothetical protein B0I35DRAFT_484083 [Stachybotrys elegans]